MRTIGIMLFDGVEELDAVGPWEVLAYWAGNWPEDGWQVVTFARTAGDIQCAKGLVVRAAHSWTDTPPLDVLVLPGGQGTRPLLNNPTTLDWIRQRRDEGTLMTSVCTGSLVFAAAGILNGRPATTYWDQLDLLQQLDPTIELRPSDRWVDSGEVITASGVSAGIDMALHLVRRLAGEERARAVRRGIQYDPAPPV
ncbi:MAG TPA: DJ-1/PfpI family protein [Acidimicrobiales bacterium]|nr:DJ-1/PfpI family protein [Acidimicrobiales bacterium]